MPRTRFEVTTTLVPRSGESAWDRNLKHTPLAERQKEESFDVRRARYEEKCLRKLQSQTQTQTQSRGGGGGDA
eukprot:SAG25_NODE_122_length_14632_cov_129.472098_5_plen_73_part_00